MARPVGVYVIKDGKAALGASVRLNRAILGGQIVAVAITLLVRWVIIATRRRLRGSAPNR